MQAEEIAEQIPGKTAKAHQPGNQQGTLAGRFSCRNPNLQQLPREVLKSRIELWNHSTGEITFHRTRRKYNRWTRRHIPGAPKTMKLTGNTSEMLRHDVGNRKKGHIFINERTGERLTLRHFEKMIDKWARLLNIQRHQSIKPRGREYHLITLIGLREAGERHP
jgi:hypothetical protein